MNSRLFRSLFAASCGAFLFSNSVSLAIDDPALASAEKARGILTGNNGIRWQVDVVSKSNEGSQSAKFDATSQGGLVHAVILQPDEAKGRKYIAEADGKMWFWKPGLSRPVSVSRRQRLSGDAAIGDIASTSYVSGYKVDSKADGDVNGEAATVYTLEANSLGDTYKQIKYWVTKKGNLGKRAEFYARSGTLLRTAAFEYGNSGNGGPLISKMTIQESGRVVTMTFSNVKTGTFPADLFNKDKMSGEEKKGLFRKLGDDGDKEKKKGLFQNLGGDKEKKGGLFQKKSD